MVPLYVMFQILLLIYGNMTNILHIDLVPNTFASLFILKICYIFFNVLAMLFQNSKLSYSLPILIMFISKHLF